MTADLKEAFLVATVEFVGWRRWNEEQAKWGIVDHATGRRRYWPEPTVAFFGRPFTLTEMCRLAKVLSGALPLHVQALFRVIDDGIGEPVPETYSDAVEALADAIEVENLRQDESPIEQPPLADQIRDRVFCEGARAALDAIRPEVRRP